MKNDSLALFGHYSKHIMKAWFQYKVDACLRSLAVFLRESAGIIVIYMMLLKFDSINGWTRDELLFLFSFIFLTYGIFILFFTGFRDFPKLVNKGTFDRFMLRPRGLVFQVIASNADWFAAIGHGGLGICLFIFSASRLTIEWSLGLGIYCFFTILGGVLIQGAIFLFLASLSFSLIETGNLKSLLFWNTRKFAGYPISIFHSSIQFLLTFVVPFAFVNYFPAQFLLRKPDLAEFPLFFIYIAPLVGPILYILSYAYWRFSLRFYKSTGS
ncbi:MAG: ABC-2 family transporter protein [Spirochaetales bacterium]|nr:ABC-2 family transporter protein [Spirochaetales bacterium]